MLKIHQLFLRTYISIFLVILLTLGVITYFWSKDIYINQIEKNLLQNIDTLSIVFNNKENLDNIEEIIHQLHEKLKHRITIIDEAGIVIADSDKELSQIKNHLNRKELIEAKNNTVGKDTRKSETINKELLYVAKKITISNKIYYIRMADYISIITDNFISLTFGFFLFVAFFLLIAFLATYFISIRVKKETDNILNFLTLLAHKKPSFTLESKYTHEFFMITKLLNKVAIKLSNKEKQKAKQNAKLKISNKQKDEIISAISHEFKNPIAIISGYTETILNDEEMPQAIKIRFLKKIYSNANKMSSIVDYTEGNKLNNFS